MSQLTEFDAYLAMFAFLEDYYYRTGSDEIGGLLGSMSLLQDGVPADAAIASDWADAIAKVRAGAVNATLRFGPK